MNTLTQRRGGAEKHQDAMAFRRVSVSLRQRVRSGFGEVL